MTKILKISASTLARRVKEHGGNSDSVSNGFVDLRKEFKAGQNFVINDLDTLNKFVFWNLNRKTDDAHVRSIKKAILNKEYMGYCLVDISRGVIIDGQHRIEAAKEAFSEGCSFGINVLMEDFSNLSEKELLKLIQRFNSQNKKWNDKQYVESHIQAGDEPYIILKNWALSHSLAKGKGGKEDYSSQYALAFLMGEKFTRNAIKNDLLSNDNMNIKEADECHEDIQKLLGEKYINAKKGSWFEAMIHGWFKFKGNKDNLNRIAKLEYGWRSFFNKATDNLIVDMETSPNEWINRYEYILALAEA